MKDSNIEEDVKEMEENKRLRFSKYLDITNERLIEGIIYYQTLMNYTDVQMAGYISEETKWFKLWKEGTCKLKEKSKLSAYKIIVRLVNQGLFDLKDGVTSKGEEWLNQ